MIIPINLSPEEHRFAPLHPTLVKLGSKEVVLIELQGRLDVVEGEKADGFIGTLQMQNDRPILIIGHHHLEGTLVSLPKPIAVLNRRRTEDQEREPGAGSVYYDMLTVVKRKITFAKRPVPIVKQT